MNTKLDILTQHYLIAAHWTDIEEDNPDAEFSPEALDKARSDCAEFMTIAGPLLDMLPNTYGAHPDCGRVHPQYGAAGHDFWFTRNHHGVGFWDRELGAIGDRLTETAHVMGESYAYLGDNGLVYLS